MVARREDYGGAVGIFNHRLSGRRLNLAVMPSEAPFGRTGLIEAKGAQVGPIPRGIAVRPWGDAQDER